MVCFEREKGDLPTLYDTPGQRNLPVVDNAAAVLETLLMQAIEQPQGAAVVRSRFDPLLTRDCKGWLPFAGAGGDTPIRFN